MLRWFPARVSPNSGTGYDWVSSALLAQLVEHLHGKEGVSGSSPEEGFASCLRLRRGRAYGLGRLSLLVCEDRCDVCSPRSVGRALKQRKTGRVPPGNPARFAPR
jgi:hypothetical protein